MQIFAETLVLAAASFGLRWGLGIGRAEVMDGARLPFWFSGSLSPLTVLYVVVLTVLAAAIAGVVRG